MMIQRQSFIQKADVNARKEAGKTAGAAAATSGDPVSELITRGLGGKKNIVDVDCCATRLRITVAEPERVRDELLKQTDSRGIVKKRTGRTGYLWTSCNCYQGEAGRISGDCSQRIRR